ncbi:CPBP family intramembrane metalloprotease [Arthrobacter tecti]
MALIETSWLLRDDEPRALRKPVPSGVEYHRALAGERRRVGRGILAIALLMAGLVGFAVALNLCAVIIDEQLLGRSGYTPLRHAAAMLSLAALVPWSMLIQRWLYGTPGPALHSIMSRFRFGVLGRSLVLVAPIWVAVTLFGFLAPGEQVPWSQTDLLAFLLISLLLTPLQAAGEEYGFRGLAFRVVGGWTRSSRFGLIIGVVLTSAIFAAIHGSADPYLLVWYFVLAAGLAIITWRTGGLEVAVLLHAVLNTVAFTAGTALHVDFGSALGSRADVVGTASNLVPAAVIVAITAGVWWTTRKTGPETTP